MGSATETAEWLRAGIHACRRDRWHEGYDLLARAARSVPRQSDLPPRLFSFLGVAMARCEGRRTDGLDLCRYALRREPREPENYANLAIVYLMLGRRRSAVRALDRGLEIAPGDEQLVEMRAEIGCRRRPPLSFLPRQHPLNVLTGRIRHSLLQQLERRRLEREIERADRESDEPSTPGP